ncbi:MAG: AMP-binding protein [Proteobacteria bacterium]|nr:AMP-binding protein [Pseudomonadota bacterium]
MKNVLPTNPKSVPYVDEGELLTGFTAGIYDAFDNVLPEGTIGHILVKGPSVRQGYINNPVATEESFTEEGWLRTGDLGFSRNRRLTITGRSKEMISIGGMNFYPHDIERVAGKEKIIDGRPVVACGVYDCEIFAEELILFDSYKKGTETFLPVINAVKERIARDFNLPVSRVLPIKSIPRTTSGKLS